MKARRIALRDVNGEVIGSWDISQLDNANTQAVMTLSIETLCDMEHWHGGQHIQLAPWGPRIYDDRPA